MIEQININFFSAINKYAGASALLDNIVIVIAEYMPYLFIAILFYLWSSSRIGGKYSALLASYSALLGVSINRFITLFYFHHRPFMANIGICLVDHAPETSFPSDHTTFMLSIAIVLFFVKPTRIIGCILLLFGLLSGVSRVFCGVHFPVDIFGSSLVSVVSASTIWTLRKKLRVLNGFIVNVYFSVLIRRRLYTVIKQTAKKC